MKVSTLSQLEDLLILSSEIKPVNLLFY